MCIKQKLTNQNRATATASATAWKSLLMRTYLYFIPVLSDNLHQAREQVGYCMGREGLSQGSEDLKRAAGVVTRGAAEGRLQGYVAQLMLQMEICTTQEQFIVT